MSNDIRAGASSSVNRLVGYVAGAAFVLAGLLGFFVAKGVAGPDDGGLLLGLRVNHLHNIAHLLIGAALLFGASKGIEAARRMNTVIGAAYLALGILGLFIAKETNDLNILALNQADNGLHIVSGIALLAVAFLTDKAHRSTSTSRI